MAAKRTRRKVTRRPVPTLLLVAGPNGAGKSTIAREHLDHSHYAANVPFVNADIAAARLSPSDTSKVAIIAGRATLQEIDRMTAARKDFAIETTLSGRGYLGLVRKLKQAGWRIRLNYVWVATPELAISRVQDRVESGGHHIPPEDIKRRYYRSIQNLVHFVAFCDDITIFDNSDIRPRVVAELIHGAWTVHDKNVFGLLGLNGGDVNG